MSGFFLRGVSAVAPAVCAVLLAGCVSQPMWPTAYPGDVAVSLKQAGPMQAVFTPSWDGRLLAFGPANGRSLLWNPVRVDTGKFGPLGPGGGRTYVGLRRASAVFNPFERGWTLCANGEYETLADFGRALSVLSPRDEAHPDIRVGRIAVLSETGLLVNETVAGIGDDPSLWSASVLFLRDASRIAVRLRPGARFDGLGKTKGRWTREGDVLDVVLDDPPEGTRLSFDAEALAARYPEGHLLVALAPVSGAVRNEPASVCFGGEDEAGGGHSRCIAFVFPTSGAEETRLSLHFVPREIREPPEDDWAPEGF